MDMERAFADANERIQRVIDELVESSLARIDQHAALDAVAAAAPIALSGREREDLKRMRSLPGGILAAADSLLRSRVP